MKVEVIAEITEEIAASERSAEMIGVVQEGLVEMPKVAQGRCTEMVIAKATIVPKAIPIGGQGQIDLVRIGIGQEVVKIEEGSSADIMNQGESQE